MSQRIRWSYDEAVEMLQRNGVRVNVKYDRDGNVKSKHILAKAPGIKVLGCIDFLVKKHKFQRLAK